ncbi:MAG: hypothetical protein RIS47_2096 [Bacteroidota bacterium]
MLFSEIIGQENTKKQLIDSVQTSRMSHAQLFSGPEGSGSLPLAIAYAQYVSCTQQGADDSCGVCPSCRKYNKLAHPDLHFVFPVATTDKVKSKPVSDLFLPEWRDILLTNPYFSFNQWLEHIGVDNKQGLIGTEEAGEIIRKLTLKTYESDYKVMVIWMPEKMNDSSANKLLKMIEEPPLKTLFLLVSEHPEQIITTIISRTQLVKVPRIDRESLEAALVAKYQLDALTAQNIARVSAGNFIKASVAVQGSVEAETFFEVFTQWMRACFGFKVLEITNIVDQQTKWSREMLKNFLNYAGRMVRENLILNLTAGVNTDLNYMNLAEQGFSQKFYPFINQRNIEGILAELELAYKHLARNGSDRLIMLDLSLKLIQLLRT